jgi:hypothetical protein
LARCAVQSAISSNANGLLTQAASTFTSGTVLMVAPSPNKTEQLRKLGNVLFLST